MKKVTAILTCFNRKEKTVTCLKTLTQLNPDIDFSFIIVDDASTDGTVESIKQLELNTKILLGNGNLFWCGGMRVGIECFLNSKPNPNDFCMFVNDDVSFYPHSIEKMFDRLGNRKNVVVVGATCDSNGAFTYGLKAKEVWYKKNISKRIYPSKDEVIGDAFNANCVLLPNRVVIDNGNMDSVYRHGLGDYDYGFMLSRAGVKIISTEDYVGVCEGNKVEGTWSDRSLPIKERIMKKESPKGSPAKEWWHFLYKNYGLADAIIHTLIPYLKIFLRK